MIQAVFIDRDGTIGGNDSVSYPGEFKPFSNILPLIRKLKHSGIMMFAFTNQPGISKGEANRVDFEHELKEFGFDQVYLCPHQHDERCLCRKPSAGMLEQAAKDNNLNLRNCVVVGDRWTDIVAAEAVNCMKILVKTGAGSDTFRRYKNNEFYGVWADIRPDFIAEDFQEAVDWICSKN